MAEVLNMKFGGTPNMETAAYFDGAGDYLKTDDDSAFDISTGDFTIEMWVNFDSFTADTRLFSIGPYDSTGIAAYIDATGTVMSLYMASEVIRTTLVIGTNRWHHIAFTRNGSALSFYMDGVLMDTGTSSLSIATSNGMYLAVWEGYLNSNFKGYMRNVRVSSTERYAAAFTPPIAEFVNDASTIFLAPFDESLGTTTFVDSSSNTITINTTGNVVSKNKQTWKSAGVWLLDDSDSEHILVPVADATVSLSAINNKRQAYFFDGDSDYIIFDDSDDWDRTTNWTVEAWINPTTASLSGNKQLVSHGTYSNGWHLWLYDGVLRFFVETSGSQQLGVTGGAVSANTWSHVMVCKVGNLYGLYINGTQTAYASDAQSSTYSEALAIGANNDGANYFGGHMKNIRIIQSNIYGALPNSTPDNTITVPTTDPTSDDDTKLLLTATTSGLYNPLCSTAYLDGTGDYLSAPNSTDFDFDEDESFTIEFWIRPITGFGTTEQLIGTGYSDGWQLYYASNSLDFYVNGANREAASWTPVLDRWQHIAIVRNVDQIIVYVDGKAIDAGSTYGAAVSSSNAFYIGEDPDQTSYNPACHFKEVRVSNSARYTADFTPSITPFTSDANTMILLHLNGTPDDTDNTNGWLTDETGNHTVTATNSVCKFVEDYRNRIVVDSSSNENIGTMVGTAKLDWLCVEGNGTGDFDGTGDYLTASDNSDWNLGATFTVQFWIKWRTLANTYFCGQFIGAGDYWYLRYSAGSWSFSIDGASTLSYTHTPIVGQWYLCTLSVDSGSGAIYINGSKGTPTTAITIGDYAAELRIGQLNGDYVNGWMDMVTINKGTAEYTSSFIPPTYDLPTSTRRIFSIT